MKDPTCYYCIHSGMATHPPSAVTPSTLMPSPPSVGSCSSAMHCHWWARAQPLCSCLKLRMHRITRSCKARHSWGACVQREAVRVRRQTGACESKHSLVFAHEKKETKMQGSSLTTGPLNFACRTASGSTGLAPNADRVSHRAWMATLAGDRLSAMI
eukprot:scaffold18307_cov17-Tisochrysis_lutea.AAC.3